MNAQQFMDELAIRLKKDSKLDQEVLALTLERLFTPQRERDVAEILEGKLEAIAMRRASKSSK